MADVPRLLLVRRPFRQLVGRDDPIVGGGVGVDRRGELVSDASERAGRRGKRRAVVVRPVRVFASPATIISSEAPTAEARADAEPPPGVGSGALNAASRSRSVRSMSFMTPPRQQRARGERHTTEKRRSNGEAIRRRDAATQGFDWRRFDPIAAASLRDARRRSLISARLR